MSDKQDTREMLVSGNVFKTMLTLSVPAVLQFWPLQVLRRTKEIL